MVKIILVCNILYKYYALMPPFQLVPHAPIPIGPSCPQLQSYKKWSFFKKVFKKTLLYTQKWSFFIFFSKKYVVTLKNGCFRKTVRKKRAHTRNNGCFSKTFSKNTLSIRKNGLSPTTFSKKRAHTRNNFCYSIFFLSHLHICPKSFFVFILRGIFFQFTHFFHFLLIKIKKDTFSRHNLLNVGR